MVITLKEWLCRYKHKEVKPEITCGDGFRVSIQGSRFHYCYPRVSNIWDYRSLEVQCKNFIEPSLSIYACDNYIKLDTVYSNVPTDLLESIIEKHGGIHVSSEKYYQVL